MPEIKSMSRLELIRLIGDVITEIDVLRSNFTRASKNRNKLDNIRDELDTTQRKLVRNVISENSKLFIESTNSLKSVNENLLKTIDDLDQITLTLETLVDFVNAAEKIAELIP